MNILSITSISNNTTYFTSSDNDVSQLEAEEESLKSQLQQVNSSKDNDKTKQAKIKELEAKIQEIQSEISQKKSKKTGGISSENKQSINNLKTEDVSDQFNGNVIDTLA